MSTKKILLSIVFIILSNCITIMGATVNKPEFKSIHQLQLNEFRNIVPKPLKSEDYFKSLTKETTTPRVKKQVLGYYTYWKTGTTNIKWELLTILAYFSAEIDSSGNITDLNGWPSSAPINEAHTHGVKVILTATLFGGSSIRTLIQSEDYRQNCIENLYNAVQNAGADGICIDFELPYSSDRDYFSTFIQELSDYFHTNMPESIVVVDTPAVNWNDRMDFDTLTDYADYLFIMAYDYHYSGGDPGPVSPLSYTDGSPWPTWASVDKTIYDYINGTYGVGDSKKSKLILGVPYYGYDWPSKNCDIPTEQRANASAVIYSSAVDKAAQYNREWDNYSHTPFYDYNCSTSYPHQAWYDDDESLGLKYDLVNQYNIGGMGMWALNYDGTREELWQKLREKFGFFYITATAGEHGSISPSGKVQVDYGKSITFTFTADNGYHIKEVIVDGNSLGSTDSYTFSNVIEDHTISVTFEQDAQNTFTITATANNGGIISPSGNIEVNRGDSITFTIKPDPGYQIDHVDVDGINQGAISSYTFEDVTDNHTIEAFFSPLPANTYTITATAETGGTIDPSGEIIVNEGENVTFVITPDENHTIKDVLVDNNSIGVTNVYTFSNVNNNHTIHAVFSEIPDNKYTIESDCEEGGSIYPRGKLIVNEGETLTFTISPDNGYTIEKVVVDGTNVGRVSSYTLKSIKKDHSIFAYFTPVSVPVLEYFNASTETGLTALTVDFSCKFKEPQGRRITKYYWIVSGDYEGNFETEEPEISLIFYQQGKYYIKVEAENELGLKGESQVITILPVDLMSYPLSINGDYNIDGRVLNITTYLINPFNTSVNASIKRIDKNNYIETKNISIEPFHKVRLSDYFNCENSLSQFEITPNSFLLIYTDIKGSNLGCAGYQGLSTDSYLNIPHIAEETDYWDTLAFVGNKNGKNLIVSVNNSGSSLEANYSNILNLDKFAQETDEQHCWGKVYDINQSKVLNGFEVFIQKNNDGAAITLNSTATNKFYIPHIPEEKDIFWTGFTFVNTENREGKIIFYLYNDLQQLIGTKTLVIGPQEKVKGLFEQLFSGEELQDAVWGYAYASVKVTGIEIYGVSGGAICGYPLPQRSKQAGILPFAITSNDQWTGLIALNPNNENAFVKFTLFSGDGNIIDEKEVKISPFMRFKSLISDLFPESSAGELAFIKYNSTKPIICIEVSGDKARTFMKALNAF